jgi:peptidoglycan/LPS O-acetylase OafA/YrhL
MKYSYRPEIDGLRAVAIFAVMTYHAEIIFGNFKVFTGGYLGVDIFFVISGYIITKIAVNEYQSGKFSIKKFFYRRIRRIFPVLLVVALVTICAGWYILLPSLFVSLSESIISSLIFSSNFYFNHSDQIYGNDNGLIKPFLHTWSLSIEEQFYIVFPFALIYCFKKKSYNLLVILLIVSFFATFSFLKIPKENFYFIYSRAWELLFGAVICIYEKKIMKVKFFRNNLSIFKVLSFILLFYSMLMFDHTTAHPSYITLLPIIFISILIIEDHKKGLVDQLLSLKIVVFVGLISYSLYLWHYPVYAYVRITEIASGDIFIKILSIIIIFIVSCISYFFIEKPIKKIKKISKKILVSILIFTLTILVICMGIILEDGYKNRFKSISQKYSNYEMDNEVLQKNTHNFLNKNKKISYIKTKKNVLVIGDSHSIGIINSFLLNKNIFEEFEFAQRRIELDFILPDKKIINTKEKIYKMNLTKETLLSEVYQDADIVVISYRFSSKGIGDLMELIKILKKDNKKIILMSSTNEYPSYSGIYTTEYDRFIIKKFRSNEAIKSDDLTKLMKKLYQEKKDFKSLNLKLKKIAQDQNIKFFSKQKYLCDDLKLECLVITDKGKKLFFDYGHLTIAGSEFIGKKLKELKIFSLDK